MRAVAGIKESIGSPISRAPSGDRVKRVRNRTGSGQYGQYGVTYEKPVK